MGRSTKRTPARRAAFLDALAATKNVRLAAAVADASVRSFYAWRRDDPDFGAAWEAALETAGDILEEEAVRRAMEALGRRVLLRGLELAQSSAPHAPGVASRRLPQLLQQPDEDPRTDDEIEARIAELLRKAGAGGADPDDGVAPGGEGGA